MEAILMQVNGACEKLKQETNAQDQHIRKMLKELADRCYSSTILGGLKMIYKIIRLIKNLTILLSNHLTAPKRHTIY